MRLWIIALVVTASTAHAETMIDTARPEAPPPAIALGDLRDSRVHIASLRVALGAEPGGSSAEVRFVLASSGSGQRETRMPIDLPVGTRVRSLAITIGKGRTATAQRMTAEGARDAFNHMVTPYVPRDPALLERAAPSDRQRDHLLLRVFPVEQGNDVAIVLQLELPALRELAIDPGPNTIEHGEVALGGTKRVATELDHATLVALPASDRAPAWDAAPARSNVDAETSLFAGPPPPPPGAFPTVTVRFGGAPRHEVTLDKAAIRRVIKAHREQLGECFQHEAQFGHPDLDGTALLTFLIGKSGKVESVGVDDHLAVPAVTACLQAAVASWDFYASDAPVEVHYGITFHLAK